MVRLRPGSTPVTFSRMLHRSAPSTVIQQFLPTSLPPPSLCRVAACGRKPPLFAAFNGLKTRSLYGIRTRGCVAMLKRNQSASAPSRTHGCAVKLKPSFIRFGSFFWNEYPWSAWTGFLDRRKTDPFLSGCYADRRVPTHG